MRRVFEIAVVGDGRWQQGRLDDGVHFDVAAARLVRDVGEADLATGQRMWRGVAHQDNLPPVRLPVKLGGRREKRLVDGFGNVHASIDRDGLQVSFEGGDVRCEGIFARDVFVGPIVLVQDQTNAEALESRHALTDYRFEVLLDVVDVGNHALRRVEAHDEVEAHARIRVNGLAYLCRGAVVCWRRRGFLLWRLRGRGDCRWLGFSGWRDGCGRWDRFGRYRDLVGIVQEGALVVGVGPRERTDVDEGALAHRHGTGTAPGVAIDEHRRDEDPEGLAEDRIRQGRRRDEGEKLAR